MSDLRDASVVRDLQVRYVKALLDRLEHRIEVREGEEIGVLCDRLEHVLGLNNDASLRDWLLTTMLEYVQVAINIERDVPAHEHAPVQETRLDELEDATFAAQVTAELAQPPTDHSLRDNWGSGFALPNIPGESDGDQPDAEPDSDPEPAGAQGIVSGINDAHDPAPEMLPAELDDEPERSDIEQPDGSDFSPSDEVEEPEVDRATVLAAAADLIAEHVNVEAPRTYSFGPPSDDGIDWRHFSAGDLARAFQRHPQAVGQALRPLVNAGQVRALDVENGSLRYQLTNGTPESVHAAVLGTSQICGQCYRPMKAELDAEGAATLVCANGHRVFDKIETR